MVQNHPVDKANGPDIAELTVSGSNLTKIKETPPYSLATIHESRNLKQARPNLVSMLTCYAKALATPSQEICLFYDYNTIYGENQEQTMNFM